MEGGGGDSGVLGLTSGAVRLVAVSAWTVGLVEVSAWTVELVAVSAWTMGLAADTTEAGWVAGKMGAVWAVGFSSWAAGRSLAKLKMVSTPTAWLTIHERFPLRRRRRCRLTHHPHGTHSHGVGLVRNVNNGGILVMTFNRDGMGGDMEVFGLEGIRMGSTLLYSVA